MLLAASRTTTNTHVELDYVFGVPTTKHMNYQVGTVLPYWFKTQIFRRKGLTPPQLYQFEHVDVEPTESFLQAKQTRTNDSTIEKV